MLLSRSGTAGRRRAKQAVMVMQSQGVQVLAGAVDVAEADQVNP